MIMINVGRAHEDVPDAKAQCHAKFFRKPVA
jgi:hypothetical protein